MNDEPLAIPGPKSPPPPRGWVVPTLLSLAMLATIGIVAYSITMQQTTNERLLKQLADLQAAQKSTPVLNAEQIAALQSIASLSETVNKIPAAMEAQSTNLEALTKTTADLSSRLENVEKSNRRADLKTMQQFLALKEAIGQGENFAEELAAFHPRGDIAQILKPIASEADEGIETEATLRVELLELLDASAQETAKSAAKEHAPRSWAARLNSQFEGMLRITRTPSATLRDPLIKLRAHSDAQAALTLLIADVESLPADAQERFADWLTEAELRREADAAIAQTEATLRTMSTAP